MPNANPFANATEYWFDAWQRSVLFLDTLNRRGNTYLEQNAKAAPHVLAFSGAVVLDGRTLERPVNYALVRIDPPEGAAVDPGKPPVVVIDPRAGHGPGIGGMKPESEIGVALNAGHPVYFIGFRPEPEPGQTIEDVCRAEGLFVEEVARHHPDVESKPIIIANCQAGWQILMTAALRPELFGPILVAGSPLSYWSGVRGKNPMRYLGGALGGTWLTALAGDLGAGIFDGANLVSNFESLNPANTFWTKPYDVYAKIDTEPERFLEFETWWGTPVLLNASEMQWIADNLFVGNRLAAGEIRTSGGKRIDLRNIKSPIVCFCSWGDNITPPQQALDWVLDLYDTTDEIVAAGQTIVYSLHPSIGHLGIFVSGKVAAREHREFVTCMEMIEVAPPGLYEAVITDVGENTENQDLIDGKYLFRLEPRTLDDIRAFGVNSPEDERKFATVARLSEANLGLYRTFAAPFVQALANPASAVAMRALHPNRMRFAVFSDKNPFMGAIRPMADLVRANRRPVSPDNPWSAAETAASSWITTWLTAFGEIRDSMTESAFLTAYSLPALQGAVGFGQDGAQRSAHELKREAAEAALKSELHDKYEQGGLEEAVLRGAIFVRRPGSGFDERAYGALKKIRDRRKPNARLALARFRAMLGDQIRLLRADEERAVATLPELLVGADGEHLAAALAALSELVGAEGKPSQDAKDRLARIEPLFGAPQSRRT